MFGGFKNNAYLCIVKLSYRGFEPHIVSQLNVLSYGNFNHHRFHWNVS